MNMTRDERIEVWTGAVAHAADLDLHSPGGALAAGYPTGRRYVLQRMPRLKEQEKESKRKRKGGGRDR